MTILFNRIWFMPVRKVANPHLIIVCFPYGGGSASKFWFWKNLQVQADIWALKLPGRENRISEPLVTSSAKLVDSIIKVLPPDSKIPFIFYGHSMGAGLSFQTILQLQKQRKLMPKLLIVSGREAPHLKLHDIEIQLSDENMVKYIQELGGLSGEISKNEDFIKQYIPKIRADYILNYNIPVEEPTPLSLHISIINGKEDPLIRRELLSEWQKHTLYPVTSTILPGGHFFMEEYTDKFIYEIEKKINNFMALSSVDQELF